jgi:hypothetical protein
VPGACSARSNGLSQGVLYKNRFHKVFKDRPQFLRRGPLVVCAEEDCSGAEGEVAYLKPIRK